MKEYKRFPIQLNTHTIMLIHLFHKHDCLADMWTGDCLHYYETNMITQEEAAKQLMYQLEDHWTPHFLMALRNEINRELKEHDEDFGTNFVNEEFKSLK